MPGNRPALVPKPARPPRPATPASTDYSTFLVVEGQDQEQYNQLLDNFMRDLQPRDIRERNLVEMMAIEWWHLGQCEFMRHCFFSNQRKIEQGHHKDWEEMTPEEQLQWTSEDVAFYHLKDMLRISELKNRVNRNYHRASREFDRLREPRRRNPEPEPDPEPQPLHQLTAVTEEPEDPEPGDAAAPPPQDNPQPGENASENPGVPTKASPTETPPTEAPPTQARAAVSSPGRVRRHRHAARRRTAGVSGRSAAVFLSAATPRHKWPTGAGRRTGHAAQRRTASVAAGVSARRFS
jgi:hypothetical protein